MDSGIVISLVLGGASILSSIFWGLIPNMRKQRIAQLEDQREKLFQDVKLFHEIEEELLNIIEMTGQVKVTVQRKVRKQVSEKNHGKVLSDYTKPSIYNKYIK